MLRKKNLLLFLFIAIIYILTGCDNSEENDLPKDVKQTIEEIKTKDIQFFYFKNKYDIPNINMEEVKHLEDFSSDSLYNVLLIYVKDNAYSFTEEDLEYIEDIFKTHYLLVFIIGDKDLINYSYISSYYDSNYILDTENLFYLSLRYDGHEDQIFPSKGTLFIDYNNKIYDDVEYKENVFFVIDHIAHYLKDN